MSQTPLKGLAFLAGFLSITVSGYSLVSDIPTVCPIYLTLSSLHSYPGEDAIFVINLGPGCTNPPDWVGLFRDNPSLSSSPPLAFFHSNGSQEQRFITDVKLGRMQFPAGWNLHDAARLPPKRGASICTNFFLASYKDDQLQMMDCFKIQPSWMSIDESMATVPFREFFIPGTHCSACYMTRSNSRSRLLKKVGFTQNFDIWSQMVFGIRYFDFSVGFQENRNRSKNLWVMNGSLKICNLIDILRDIRRFVIYSHEVIFLDFNQFTLGFFRHPGHHLQLIKLLERELGDVAFRKESWNSYMNSYDLTLEMMKRKTVLIMYNEKAMLPESNLLWPSWKRHSSEHLKSNEVNEFMKNLFSRKNPDSPNGIGWVLTAIQGIESAYEPYRTFASPRDRAEEINAKITPLLGGPWSWRANVVAIDYFTSTNLVDIALLTNRNKLMKHRLAENMTFVEI